ncbi:MAG: hypothetical protein CM15mP49_25890 [Actinomycetota bacterium]|nr:MAG: hypothetical protein CM15mP49_25890 [Actinomycetota bacterium]
MGGQISLGQMAFFFTGSAIAGKLIVEWDGDLILAILIGRNFWDIISNYCRSPSITDTGPLFSCHHIRFELAMVSYFLNTRFLIGCRPTQIELNVSQYLATLIIPQHEVSTSLLQ